MSPIVPLPLFTALPLVYSLQTSQASFSLNVQAHSHLKAFTLLPLDRKTVSPENSSIINGFLPLLFWGGNGKAFPDHSV